MVVGITLIYGNHIKIIFPTLVYQDAALSSANQYAMRLIGGRRSVLTLWAHSAYPALCVMINNVFIINLTNLLIFYTLNFHLHKLKYYFTAQEECTYSQYFKLFYLLVKVGSSTYCVKKNQLHWTF